MGVVWIDGLLKRMDLGSGLMCCKSITNEVKFRTFQWRMCFDRMTEMENNCGHDRVASKTRPRDSQRLAPWAGPNAGSYAGDRQTSREVQESRNTSLLNCF